MMKVTYQRKQTYASFSRRNSSVRRASSSDSLSWFSRGLRSQTIFEDLKLIVLFSQNAQKMILLQLIFLHFRLVSKIAKLYQRLNYRKCVISSRSWIVAALLVTIFNLLCKMDLKKCPIWKLTVVTRVWTLKSYGMYLCWWDSLWLFVPALFWWEKSKFTK